MRPFLLILVLFSVYAFADPVAKVGDASAPSINPNSTVSIDESQKTEFALAPEEKKPLLAQFKKELSDEDRALDHQDASGLKEFKAAQSQQVKDWRNQEKKSRRAFFDAHLSGPDRRDYVQSYIGRKKAFDQRQKDDLNSFKIAQKEKHDLFKQNQKIRDAQFKAAIDRNTRPSKGLWTP
jgi:hypothetical protein